jgi:hypothetical protein
MATVRQRQQRSAPDDTAGSVVPADVWSAVIAFLDDPTPVGATSRALRAVVLRHTVHWEEGTAGGDSPSSARVTTGGTRRPLWVRLAGVRFDAVPSWIPEAVRSNTRLDVVVRGSWHERRSLLRLLTGTPGLRRLGLVAENPPPLAPAGRLHVVSAAGNVEEAVRAVLTTLPVALHHLALRLPRVGLRDPFARMLQRALPAAPRLASLRLDLSLNGITLAGVEAIVDGLIRMPALTRLTLDVTSNWVRGAGFGQALARLAAARGLRHLDLRFGGWGMRKQYGLAELARLGGPASPLVSFALTIRGAPVGGDGLRKAVAGVAAAPGLRDLDVDLSVLCTLGSWCYLAWVAAAQCATLRHFGIRLAAPDPAVIDGLRGFSTVSHPVELAIDFHSAVGPAFTDACALALLRVAADPPQPPFPAWLPPLRLSVRAPRIDPAAWDRLRRSDGFNAGPGARLRLDAWQTTG